MGPEQCTSVSCFHHKPKTADTTSQPHERSFIPLRRQPQGGGKLGAGREDKGGERERSRARFVCFISITYTKILFDIKYV